ncbi:TfoX/Sxy family protein [Hahella ganghwensis]|uniref:TfoX/Sxy family protein n=1 Tax=Hahella ganghwensis TaxID=286420 RepID=UPI000367AB9C|nr:TfoX/Sxy family protein [Hahella ganghwensis]
MRLRDLQGLGPKSEQQLMAVGITSPEQLREIGPIRAYLTLVNESATRPSLNFLYALVGAVEGRCWTDIART